MERKLLVRRVVRAENARYDLEHWRPRTRAECRDLPRPCPYVGCRYHLYLDASHAGGIKYNYPALEVWECEHTCALDIAEQYGELNLEQIGRLMNVTRERVRQIEEASLAKLNRRNRRESFEDIPEKTDNFSELMKY